MPPPLQVVQLVRHLWQWQGEEERVRQQQQRCSSALNQKQCAAPSLKVQRRIGIAIASCALWLLTRRYLCTTLATRVPHRSLVLLLHPFLLLLFITSITLWTAAIKWRTSRPLSRRRFSTAAATCYCYIGTNRPSPVWVLTSPLPTQKKTNKSIN